MPAKISDRMAPTPDGRLPVSPDTLQPPPEAHPAQSADGPTLDSDASRILIVDDNPDILMLVSKMATHLGYRPTIAENGVDALSYLTKGHFDLVITDYNMPFMDGYQLADHIKEKHFGTKVIIMTGHSESDVVDLLDGSGIVDGLLLKPFSMNTMKTKIEMAIQPHGWKWTF
jgi:CheY-like chemotaxis protein